MIISCTHTIFICSCTQNILILYTGSINHVDEQTSTIPNPTSTFEDRAHIKGKSIANEDDILSSDEDTEDEHGYIDRICGISKGNLF